MYCETHRNDASLLPPGLVMAVLDVESGFDPWAVSSAGAVGLMQVMPFWPEQLGMRRYELTRVAANISMGCAILRYYLDSERRDVRRALERYNGSIGRRDYPDRVIVRWTTYWNGADDLGPRSAGQPVLNRSGHSSRASSIVSAATSTDLGGRRPDPQPGDERLDRLIAAAGEHLDTTVRQIARMAGDTGGTRTLGGAGAIVDALHAPRDQAAPHDP